jgi:hypothetical protein
MLVDKLKQIELRRAQIKKEKDELYKENEAI